MKVRGYLVIEDLHGNSNTNQMLELRKTMIQIHKQVHFQTFITLSYQNLLSFRVYWEIDSLVFFRCYRCSFVVHDHCLPSLDDNENKRIKGKKRLTDRDELIKTYRRKW